MSLYVNTVGDGPDIVFLHGWALNSAVWKETVIQLAPYYRVTTVDLPGHGQSEYRPPFDLAHITQQIVEVVPARASYVGWSLGGMIATNIAAQFPQRVEKLVLVASNAQFVRSDDWPCGMDEQVMRQFGEFLQKDYRATVNRFIALQTLGQPEAKETLRTLKERMFAHGEPNIDALINGMEILTKQSLIGRLDEIRCPVLLMLGRLDALVPVSAGAAMQNKLSDARLQVFDRSAHAPFISQNESFLKTLREFLSET